MLLVVAVAAILALPGSVYMNLLEMLERQFVFFPMPRVERTPADLGIPFEDVYFETNDGYRLNGWFIPAPAGGVVGDRGNAEVTLLWFHGNAGNTGHRVDDLALFHHLLGVKVFIFDYRGYGNSQGKPSERGVYRDSRAALAYLMDRSDVDSNRIVYYGRSLGAAVAVELALNHRPQGMVLYSPFTSLADMGAGVIHILAGAPAGGQPTGFPGPHRPVPRPVAGNPRRGRRNHTHRPGPRAVRGCQRPEILLPGTRRLPQ